MHFETILRNVTVCALTSSRLDDFSAIVYCTDDNIFGGWKLLPLKYPRYNPASTATVTAAVEFLITNASFAHDCTDSLDWPA